MMIKRLFLNSTCTLSKNVTLFPSVLELYQKRIGSINWMSQLDCFQSHPLYGHKVLSLTCVCFFPLSSGLTTRRFVGHTKDVLSVAFSADNRQIVSGSRDKTVKLWNTLGVCKYTIQVHWQLVVQLWNTGTRRSGFNNFILIR